ncbi:hypothetical protein K435DRAFT_848348 [Dendrothele bispora CBS 962.96]|uniref:Transmembrane protein n=1 Tax=Dendrothele bispora (strain CBS 962.96) TaxID=1314807 RepID=A0A4V6T5R5_DENBC|nr:hypothetical protein K435DRAFT_848348 [Dendrothele bispora CBS 962.96]
MVNWNSPEELVHDSDVFTKFMHVLLGLYAWEWATSLPFDFSVLTGRRGFKWPMTFYFLNRYCLLAALVGIIVSMNVQSEIDCQSLYMFNQIMGNFAIGLSSINLSIRTIAVWKSHYFVIIPLVALILGHWVLLLRTVVLVKANWVDALSTCQVTGNDPKLITAVYIYSMIFDFIVMCLTGIKLGFGTRQKSELVKMLYLDGLMYFLIAFTANLVAVVFSVLNLNPVMSIIADVPATVIATIAACRVVRRLNSFVNSQGVDLYTPHSGARPGQVTSGGFSSGTVQFSSSTRQETRIQMDVISKTHYDDLERGESPGEVKSAAY